MKFKTKPVDADRCPVMPGQSVDIAAAIQSGRVPVDSAPDTSSFNGIDNPGDIIGRPRDYFEALELEASYRSYRKPEEVKSDVKSVDTPAPESSQE